MSAREEAGLVAAVALVVVLAAVFGAGAWISGLVAQLTAVVP